MADGVSIESRRATWTASRFAMSVACSSRSGAPHLYSSRAPWACAASALAASRNLAARFASKAPNLRGLSRGMIGKSGPD
eukprot:scaffold227162_cov30-Tisochrysis_lutea.AAC.3